MKPSWLPSPETIARFSIFPSKKKHTGWEFEGKLTIKEFLEREARLKPDLTAATLRNRIRRGYYPGLKAEFRRTNTGQELVVSVGGAPTISTSPGSLAAVVDGQRLQSAAIRKTAAAPTV